eukprot:6406870-Prymnesium_polylepis.1
MNAVLRVASYSSESHDSIKSAYRYRREVSLSYSNVSHRKALKILVELLGSTRKVSASVGGKTRCRPVASTARMDLGAKDANGTGKYDEQGPGRAHPDARAVVAQAGGGHQKDALKLGRQLEEADPPGVLLEPKRRLHIVHARPRRKALVEAHQRLDLVSHACPLPGVLHPSSQSEQRAAGVGALEAA